MLGISKEIVHGLPEVHYPGRVILIDSAAKAKDAVAYLMKQTQIGFDTETRPSFQKNHRYKVSLVQLSTPGECFLFRLKQIGSLDGLMSIFENPRIQKIGLSLKDDFHSLAKLCEFTPAGFVELQTFVKEYEIADNSLQKIYALLFNRRISKNQRLTNWEAPELTIGQQNYAAIDAWACVEIYNHLCAGRFHPEECPYRIDDQTALMLQNSVGIHAPLKHPLEGVTDAEAEPYRADADSPQAPDPNAAAGEETKAKSKKSSRKAGTSARTKKATGVRAKAVKSVSKTEESTAPAETKPKKSPKTKSSSSKAEAPETRKSSGAKAASNTDKSVDGPESPVKSARRVRKSKAPGPSAETKEPARRVRPTARKKTDI